MGWINFSRKEWMTDAWGHLWEGTQTVTGACKSPDLQERPPSHGANARSCHSSLRLLSLWPWHTRATVCHLHEQQLPLLRQYRKPKLREESCQRVSCSAAESVSIQFCWYEVCSWEGGDKMRGREGRRGKEQLRTLLISYWKNKSQLLSQVFKALQSQAWLPVFATIPQVLSWSPKGSLLPAAQTDHAALTSVPSSWVSGWRRFSGSPPPSHPSHGPGHIWLDQNSPAFLFPKLTVFYYKLFYVVLRYFMCVWSGSQPHSRFQKAQSHTSALPSETLLAQCWTRDRHSVNT